MILTTDDEILISAVVVVILCGVFMLSHVFRIEKGDFRYQEGNDFKYASQFVGSGFGREK